MPGKKSLLFYGELPPCSIHGIAFSNQINLKQLKEDFDLVIIEERSALMNDNSGHFTKILRLIRNFFCISKNAARNKFDFFYLTFSVSLTGSLKTLVSIISFRLFSRGVVVLHIHRGDFFTWRLRKLANRFLADRIIYLSNRIIVLSDIQKSAFDAIYKRPSFVLHNTIESEYSFEFKEKNRRKFIYLSNYLKEKGILELLDVFTDILKSCPGITLHTYGAFPSNEIRDAILTYSGNGISIGQVLTGRPKFEVINDADCLILPSINEGEPLIILEAMSLGTPVISTKVGSIPEMLGTDYPFLVVPGDRTSLKEGIAKFINFTNPSEISEKLKERYNLFYSNRIHSEQLRGIFNFE